MKRISLLLVFVMLFATIFALSVFADDTACEHDWFFTGYGDEYGESMPTCDIEGIANYKCLLCEETKTENVYHRLLYFVEYVEGQEPTCTEYGYAKYECNWCSESETRKVAPQHQYESTAYTPSTCTENGSQTWTCALCGDSYDEVVDARGHNQKWQYDSTTATCTQAGVEIYGCYNCSEKIEVEVEAYGHEWSVDDSTLDLENHTVNKVCSTCGAEEAISSLGMEADPIEITVPGSFTASVTGNWTYYTFTHTEGYITFTFDTDNVNVMIKDTTGKYATQYFWGGNTTWTGELMADGSYVIAICSKDGSAIDIAVETTFVAEDVPNIGEIASKPIVMEGVNYAYTSTGKVWYTIETPSAGTVSFKIEGNATVSYGTDPEALTVYTAPFVDEYGWTTYYILVESEEEVTVVVNVEAPKGSMDNPLEIVVGENNTVEYAGGWQTYYAVYEATSAGTLTITFDSENAVIHCGTHPYMMQTFVESGAIIEVSPWTTYYFGVTTNDYMPATFDITASFEIATVEPEGPSDNIGTIIDSMDVVTTDTYGYFDMYTYTAVNAGKYTFFVPAGLGLYSKSAKDAYGDAEVGFYDNVAGDYVTVELAAGEEYSFYIGALTKDTWTIDVYYLDPTALNVGDNTISNFVDAWNGDEYTFTSTEGGKFVISGSNNLVVIINEEVVLEAGSTYVFEIAAGETLTIYVASEDELEVTLTIAEAHTCDYTELQSVVYANGYLSAGTATYACSCGETTEVEAEAIFKFLGYSIKENGTAMCAGYEVNREWLEAYEEINETTIKFGLVNTGYDNLVNADGKPVNVDGTAAEVSKGKVAIRAIEEKDYTSFAMKMSASDWSAIADVNVVLCAYVIEGDTVSYICNNSAMSDSVVAVTYNQIQGGNA